MNWLRKLGEKLVDYRKLEALLGERIGDRIDFRTRELKAMEVLRPYFPQGYLFETDFSMSFQTIQHIANDIVAHRPRTILEIGSGLSTLILAKLLKELDYGAELISVDQDPEWQELLKPQAGQVRWMAFGLEPSREYSYQGKGSWFAIPAGSDLLSGTFDLVLVDGPKGSAGSHARYGIVPFLKGRLSDRAIFYLDDTHREEEQAILAQAREQLGFPFTDRSGQATRLAKEDRISTRPS